MDYKNWKPLAALVRQQIFDADMRNTCVGIEDVAHFLTVEDMSLDYQVAMECNSFAADER